MLEIREFSKKYGKNIIFSNLNYKFERGVYFIVGENGIGKSTFLRCISGVDRKYMGDITYFGKKLETKKIGYLPQNFGALHNLSVLELFHYVSLLKADEVDEEEINGIITKLHLEKYKNQVTQHLSGGTERRVGIGLTLLKNPEIIILDEPTAGLDLKERIHLLESLIKIEIDGILLISTHNLDDIARIPHANSLLLTKDKFIDLKEKEKQELETEYLCLVEK